jgi:hemolysin activation/secretion protein
MVTNARVAAAGDRLKVFSCLAIGMPLLAMSPAAAQTGNPGGAPPAVVEDARQAPDRFAIMAIDVSGATILSGPEIERLIYPFLGPDRSNDDVVAAQKALESAYAAKGYNAVQVDVPVQPQETFSRGIVQIAINETAVGRVRVVGSEHHSLGVARAQVPSLVEGRPLNLTALQRDVADANRFPDRQIDPVFRAGQVPGTIDVDLKVEDSPPYHASIELNNDNSPNTEPLRLVSTVRYTNLWNLGHSVSLTSSLAPQDTSQSAVISASYNAPLIGTPWSVLMYGYTSNSNVAALGGTNVLGDGYQIGLRAVYRLPGEGIFQQVSFGPDFKSFKERILLANETIRPTTIRYIPFVAEYTGSVSSELETYGLTLGVTAGLRIVKELDCVDPETAQVPDQTATCLLTGPTGGSVGFLENQFQARAVDARENFVHFNVDANYTRVLPGDVIVAIRLAGQLADSSLITNEQFGIGGVSSVRGYYVSEFVGDNGVQESVEVRAPNLAPMLGQPFDELRFFTFGDIGYARVRRPALEQTGSLWIAGIGGGFRFQLQRYFSGEFLVGVPVRDGPISDRGDPRYSFSIKGEF